MKVVMVAAVGFDWWWPVGWLRGWGMGRFGEEE